MGNSTVLDWAMIDEYEDESLYFKGISTNLGGATEEEITAKLEKFKSAICKNLNHYSVIRCDGFGLVHDMGVELL